MLLPHSVKNVVGDHVGQSVNLFLHTHMYTVSHKNRATLFSIINPAFLGRFFL